MSRNKRKIAISLAFVGMLLLAGCVNIAVHSSVNADGSIEEYQMQINTSRSVYGLLEQSAEEDGFDSVRDSILSDVDENRAEHIEYDEEFNGDRVSITISASDYVPGEESDISITEEDGILVYEDTTFVNESAQDEPMDETTRSMLSSMSVDYYLTMPGDIVDSNADTVDGNTAEWHESGGDAFNDNRIYAVSETPTFPSLPGFGIVPVVVAIAAVTGAILVRVRGRA